MQPDRPARIERTRDMQPTVAMDHRSRRSSPPPNTTRRLYPRMPAVSSAPRCIHRQYWRRPLNDLRGETDPSLVPAFSHHLLHDVACDEGDVGGPLSKPAHQIRVPLSSEGYVDAHAITFADEFFLQVAAHAIQHLKLELIAADVVLARESLCFPDDCF